MRAIEAAVLIGISGADVDRFADQKAGRRAQGMSVDVCVVPEMGETRSPCEVEVDSFELGGQRKPGHMQPEVEGVDVVIGVETLEKIVAEVYAKILSVIRVRFDPNLEYARRGALLGRAIEVRDGDVVVVLVTDTGRKPDRISPPIHGECLPDGRQRWKIVKPEARRGERFASV